MFPQRYFPERYFPQRYFMNVGEDTTFDITSTDTLQKPVNAVMAHEFVQRDRFTQIRGGVLTKRVHLGGKFNDPKPRRPLKGTPLVDRKHVRT